MIKILPIICVLGFLFPCQGDANLDGSANVLDVVLIVQSAINASELTDGSFDNSDINNDDTIDVLDIVLVIDIILIGDFECNETHLDLSLDWEFAEDLSYFDSEQLNNIMDEMSNLTYLEGVVVIHNGKIVSEDYYNGSSINQTFNIWSITKSFTSTLIGQAIDQGYISSQYLTLNNLLPVDFPGQPYLYNISLHNLLSMSSGYADGFGYPYWINATTTQLAWMPYTFPGFFFYNNSACHLNSHVLFHSTGMTPYEFANINLFSYLGIEEPNWLDGYLNINDGSASLELRLRDMVKLGQLYLQDGWSGQEKILSSEWIDEATSLKVETMSSIPGYGYLWWLPPGEGYMAIGYGGQYIAVYPERGLVIGTHSAFNGDQNYQSQLLNYIHNDIAPIFNNE